MKLKLTLILYLAMLTTAVRLRKQQESDAILESLFNGNTYPLSLGSLLQLIQADPSADNSTIIMGWRYVNLALDQMVPDNWRLIIDAIPEHSAICIAKTTFKILRILGFNISDFTTVGKNRISKRTKREPDTTLSTDVEHFLEKIRDNCGQAAYEQMNRLRNIIDSTLNQMPKHFNALRAKLEPKIHALLFASHNGIMSGEHILETMKAIIYALKSFNAKDRAKIASLFPKLAEPIRDHRLGDYFDLYLNAINGNVTAAHKMEVLGNEIFKKLNHNISSSFQRLSAKKFKKS